MKKATYLLLIFFLLTNALFAQSIDDPFSQKKMKKDLDVFEKIRVKANSGIYKHRTKQEIDSIYIWANNQIEKSSTYRDFFNIIYQITDFEGSLHNNTSLPKKLNQSLKNEKNGYFPYPVKWIEGKWINNYDQGEIPLGAEIVTINNEKINNIVNNLYKYYTTDGINSTGKLIGINRNFSRYYRLHYGTTDSFKIQYKEHNSEKIQLANLKSVGYADYYKNFESRYSFSFDEPNYKDWEIEEMYSYKKLNAHTGMLSINSFAIGGNAQAEEHKRYKTFLDSIFSKIKKDNTQNLIVDIRNNGGGTDPNDLVTYSYLTNRKFSENEQAWISFKKIPYLRYIESTVPSFLRFLGVGKYNKWFQKEFYIEKENGYYQGSLSEDHKVRLPNANSFEGNIYLLISPRVASAGSLFGAMVTGNKNSVVIGEEAMGGYYGHNGHTPLTYILPKSKIETTFSIVNLEQDVSKNDNQRHNRGIIPDYNITQTYNDFLNHTDTPMNFVIDFIKKDMSK